MSRRGPVRQVAILIAALTLISGCSGVVNGQASSPSQPSSTKTPTAAELCQLMTPADFPVSGQLRPGSPKAEEKFSPDCNYDVKTGGIGEGLSISLSLIPEATLKPADFEGRTETPIAGKRTAVGQGKIKGEPGECEVTFDSPAGRWLIVVIDHSAPDRDGCATARHVAERVIPRVP
ncbi:DUF3558 family protein [Allokutzneria albata]|uniref:DUF3558 family protein n=1 Tax=Allokutzneria albata TaxID=211114 RepID=UPI001E2D5310|nr:DUF3558 family protein [Allokutzneria albata]